MSDSLNKRLYDHKSIESKWQRQWEEKGVYKTEDFSSKPKQYILDMFPYPSGEGLHVGHPRGYIATDVFSRKKRMEGFNVLHPMGWDAFGLPAENFAIKNKVHPSIAVNQNVARFKEQLSIIGLDYDWSREINTTDPEFYKWTQWVFLQLYKKGLAYESNEPVNWCPTDKTVLANEDVEPDGTCERCGTKVEKKPLRQWVLKITDYADRMLADLDKLPKWPEGVKEAQRNWIGKNEGSEIDFPIEGQPQHPIKVFTTRADTLFGVTFIGVSAGLAKKWLEMGWKPTEDVKDYISKTIEEDTARDFKEKEKTGIYAGFDAINPANKEKVPVWITNYVMNDVGTGAIMGVPAHDERDFEFAQKYNLPIRNVIARPATEFPLHEVSRRDGTVSIVENNRGEILVLQNSANIEHYLFPQGGIENGENPIECAIREIREESGFNDIVFVSELGCDENFFEMRDNTTRHRITYSYHFKLQSDSNSGQDLDEEESEFIVHWMEPKVALQKINVRNHKVFLERYLGIKSTCFLESGILVNSERFNGFTSEEAKQKITEFVGGKIKSTYRIKDWVFSRQRYWGEPIPVVHCDKCGVVGVPESELPVVLPNVESYEPTGTGESPLANIEEWVNTTCPKCGGHAKRETNTMPQWAGSSWYYLRYVDPENKKALIDPKKEKDWLPVDVYVGGDHATRHLIYARFWHKFLFDVGIVSTEEPFPRLEFLGFILAEDGRKMSKRWGNIINPDDVVKQFGADAFRLYEMFIGPFESTVPWSTNGLVGTYRFIEKVWVLSQKLSPQTKTENLSLLHKTIKKVSEDIENFKFNTAVSSLMIFVNEVSKEGISQEDCKTFLKLLAPFAPHITEELWYELGETESIHLAPWPKYDESKVVESEITIGVQINGKVRTEITLTKDMEKNEIEKLVMELPKVKDYTEGKTIEKIVIVPNRIINIVIKD